MSSVLITKNKLTSIADSIRTVNGTKNKYTLDAMPAAIGALSDYKKIWSQEIVAENVTNTTFKLFLSLNTNNPDIYTQDYILYMKIRDSNGPRPGYWLGSDNFAVTGTQPEDEATISATFLTPVSYRCDSDGKIFSRTSGYGLYGYQVSSKGLINIRSLYSAQYSLIIEGTYNCDIYLLKWPGNLNPWITN